MLCRVVHELQTARENDIPIIVVVDTVQPSNDSPLSAHSMAIFRIIIYSDLLSMMLPNKVRSSVSSGNT